MTQFVCNHINVLTLSDIIFLLRQIRYQYHYVPAISDLSHPTGVVPLVHECVYYQTALGD